MYNTSLVVTADRGKVRAYRVSKARGRGPRLKLVQAFDIPNANKLSHARHTRGLVDWPKREEEQECRVCRQLGREIARIVRRNATEAWALAAPKSIYQHLVNALPSEMRERIIERVPSDLVKTPAAELPDHFQSLRPM